MNAVAQRRLRRLADATGMPADELYALLVDIRDEEPSERPPTGKLGADGRPITGAREVPGEGHRSISYVEDAHGTAIVPRGYEPPPGYHGPNR